MKKTLIFDLGGVLEIHNTNSFFEWIKKKFNVQKEIKPIFKKWEIMRDLDEIDEHEFFKGFTKELGIKIDEKEFYDEYYNNYVSQCYDVLNFIKDNLTGKYELFVFSNNSRINIRKFKKKYDFEKLFNKCVYSYTIKARKPDKIFFTKALQLIKHKGEECIFFDDQLKSKQVSEELGIKFIQFINLDQLKAELRSMRIIT